jgi:predicted nucleotidyltransferase
MAIKRGVKVSLLFGIGIIGAVGVAVCGVELFSSHHIAILEGISKFALEGVGVAALATGVFGCGGGLHMLNNKGDDVGGYERVSNTDVAIAVSVDNTDYDDDSEDELDQRREDYLLDIKARWERDKKSQTEPQLNNLESHIFTASFRERETYKQLHAEILLYSIEQKLDDSKSLTKGGLVGLQRKLLDENVFSLEFRNQSGSHNYAVTLERIKIELEKISPSRKVSSAQAISTSKNLNSVFSASSFRSSSYAGVSPEDEQKPPEEMLTVLSLH